VYIGANKSFDVSISGRIFADNLAAPLDFSFSVKINVTNRELSLDEPFEFANGAE
jgi:hypothetical protein